jgi:hypothetical protein
MRFVVAAVVLSALAAAPAMAQKAGKKIQCWTDDKGQRMCGDRVPPEYAGKDRDIMKGGRVVETKKILTPEEAAAERAKKKAEENAKNEAHRRAQYDRALLETFRSAKDIEKMRDERLLLVDSRIAALQKNSADTDKGLAGLQARAEKMKQDGKPVDKKLEEQIKQFEKSQAQNTRALKRNQEERDSIVTKFGEDLARYNELKGNRVAQPVAAPGSTAHPPPAATPATPAQPAAPAAKKG